MTINGCPVTPMSIATPPEFVLGLYTVKTPTPANVEYILSLVAKKLYDDFERGVGVGGSFSKNFRDTVLLGLPIIMIIISIFFRTVPKKRRRRRRASSIKRGFTWSAR